LPCRPCPLAQQYIGVTVKKPLQRFQLMNEICYNKVRGVWQLDGKLAVGRRSLLL
jgi:hypothetical protein